MSPAATSLNPPSWLRFVLLLVGLGLSAYCQWNISQRTEWFWSTSGLILGAVLTALALGPLRPLRAVETRPLQAPVLGAGAKWFGGIAAIVGFAFAAYGAWLLTMHWQQRFEWGFALVVGGTALWSAGLGRIDHAWRKDAEPTPWLRWEILIFVAILALGLFLRFYRFGEFPPPDGSCAIEEPQSGMGAVAIRDGERPWEFLLDRWVLVPFMAWFGDTMTAIRIPFALLSWVTIIPLYLLLRELVSRPAALSATLLFAFARWHLVYARSAHNIFGPTLPLILLALYFAVRAYRRGGLAVYPWIGLIVGYTLYTYAGYRGTIAFLGLFFVISLVQHLWEYRQAVIPSARAAIQHSLRGQFVGLGLAVLGFLLLIVPLAQQLRTGDPKYFLEAAVRATNSPAYYHDDTRKMLDQRLDRVRDTASIFIHNGDSTGVFNVGGAPQLDPISGTVFVLGLVYCTIWGFRRLKGYFVVYFVVLLAFGTVFTHNFDVRRLQGVIPLIFILGAFFLDAVIAFARRRFGRAAWVPLAAGAVLLGGAAFADNYRFYFRDMMSSHAVRTAFHTNYTVAIRYYHDMPDDGFLQIISEMNNFFLPSDYAWWRGDRLPGSASHDLWPHFAGESGPWAGREVHALIRLPDFEGESVAELVRKRFPGATCERYQHPDGIEFVSFMACRIREHSNGRVFQGGAQARYFREGRETPFLERREPVISQTFHPDACHYPEVRYVPACYARWEADWSVEAPGKYYLRVESRNGTVRVYLDGLELRSTLADHYGPGQSVHTSLTLEPGVHRLEIETRYRSLDPGGTRVLVRRGGEREWRLLEFADVSQLVDRTDEVDTGDDGEGPLQEHDT